MAIRHYIVLCRIFAGEGMPKIPVERTISSAYSFAFKNILTVIGVAWFPYVLLCGIAAGLVFSILPALITPGGPQPAALGALFAELPLLFFLLFLAHAMVTVGLMERALGLKTGPVFIYFSLGSSVWRLFGAAILIEILLIIMVTVEGLVIAAVIGAAESAHNSGLGLLAAILIFAAVLWTIYFMVRIWFFIPAVVVAEEHIGIGRSWHLGGGNFWRIFLVFLAIYIPVSMAASVLMQAFYGNALMRLTLSQTQTSDPALFLHQFLGIFIANAPYLAIIQLIQMIILSGLGNGAIAAAYRGITQADHTEPAAPAMS